MDVLSASQWSRGAIQPLIDRVLGKIDDLDIFINQSTASAASGVPTLTASNSSLIELTAPSGVVIRYEGSNFESTYPVIKVTSNSISGPGFSYQVTGELTIDLTTGAFYGEVERITKSGLGIEFESVGSTVINEFGETVFDSVSRTYSLDSSTVTFKTEGEGDAYFFEYKDPEITVRREGNWDHPFEDFEGLLWEVDTLQGTSGNDFFFETEGDDTYLGGEGEDTLEVTGSRADYSVTSQADGSQLLSHLRYGERDVLKSIEVLEFSDGSIRLDSLSTSPRSSPQGFLKYTGFYPVYGDGVAGEQQFFLDYAQKPAVLYLTCILFGVSSDYIADLFGIPQATVVGFWASNGFDPSVL